MDFERKEDVSTNGTCFQCYLPGEVTANKLAEVFGPCNRDGYWDEEKGYDGNDWTFRSDTGLAFKVYARWGHYRVGAHDEEGVEAFAAWLCERLGLAERPKLAEVWISPIGTVERIR
jgi:hypothetical protein